MNHFKNILYVSQGSDEPVGLKQAMALAHQNRAELKVLVIHAEFPKSHQEYAADYAKLLRENMSLAVDKARAALQLDQSLNVPVEVQCGRPLSDCIIREVLRSGHDLVVKESHVREEGGGLKSLDMDLLRKCPCPVWLSHPITRPQAELRVAVAIDPESDEPAGENLALELVKLAHSLASTGHGQLQVISCWEYEYEGFLRHNPWNHISEQELGDIVRDVEAQHRAALEALLQKAGLAGKVQVNHLRGEPQAAIPAAVRELGIDLLVMGTLARTGVPGLIMGNTAEDVVQRVTCSLMALKPAGFVSPVKAYD